MTWLARKASFPRLVIVSFIGLEASANARSTAADAENWDNGNSGATRGILFYFVLCASNCQVGLLHLNRRILCTQAVVGLPCASVVRWWILTLNDNSDTAVKGDTGQTMFADVAMTWPRAHCCVPKVKLYCWDSSQGRSVRGRTEINKRWNFKKTEFMR